MGSISSWVEPQSLKIESSEKLLWEKAKILLQNSSPKNLPQKFFPKNYSPKFFPKNSSPKILPQKFFPKNSSPKNLLQKFFPKNSSPKILPQKFLNFQHRTEAKKKTGSISPCFLKKNSPPPGKKIWVRCLSLKRLFADDDGVMFPPALPPSRSHPSHGLFGPLSVTRMGAGRG